MKFKYPKRLAKLLQGYTGTWAIAGGWAIDLFLNKETRSHKDIEVFILRAEQLKFKSYLSDWKFNFVYAGKLIPWADEYLELPIHEIHGQNEFGEAMEVLLNEEINGSWQFRRNRHIEYPINRVIISSVLGIPIVSPEIVLLYKARINQENDILDLRTTLPNLDISQVRILKHWITDTHGNHEWLQEIDKYINHKTG